MRTRPALDSLRRRAGAQLRPAGGALLTAALLSVAPGTATASTSPDGAAPCQASDPTLPVQAYLDALVSHDGRAVPFTPRVRRVENGLVTGRTGPQIQHDLTYGLQYRIITGIRDQRTETYPAADNPGATTVYVRYLLDLSVFGFRATARIRERFDVRCGQIAYIKATILLP